MYGGGAPAASQQATAMVVDSAPMKAPEQPKEAVPSALEPKGNMLEILESSEKGAQKNKGKPYCYRCCTKGHTIHECTVVLCCEICYGDHTTKLCPNSKKTNTSAIPCGYVVEGLGFYFIPVVENAKVNVQEKKAVVRVLEGSFTVDQLIVELEKLLPDKKHKWEIETKGTDAFIINFPSADLLEIVVIKGPMDAKAVEGRIRFEKGTDNEVYKREIEKVWVQFRGLPQEFKKFPIIWAVGTILGVPQAVDTIFTKNTGRARMKVAVLDPNLIPDFVDVVIGDYVYELQFAVEDDTLNGEPQLIDMDSTKEGDPKEENPKEGDPKEENPKGGNSKEKMDVDGKIGDAEAPGNGNGDLPPMVGQHSGPNGAAQLEEIGESTITQSKPVKPSKKPRALLSQSGGDAWKATMLPPQIDSGNLNNKFNSGTASPVRSSKRNASTMDQDSTEKATKLKAKKNLESALDKGKMQQPPSFISQDDSSLVNSTSSLGVVLGSNDHDIFNSLKCLKDIEHNRLLENAKLREENFVLVEDASTVCSNEDIVDLEALNLICSKIAEGLGDGGCDPLILQTPVSQKMRGQHRQKKNHKKR